MELAKIYDADFSHYELSKLQRQLDNFIDDVRADPDLKKLCGPWCSCNEDGSIR